MLRWLVGIAALLALCAPAAATDLPARVAPSPLLTPAPLALWTVTIGVEGRMLPSYEGSDSFTFAPFPMFSIRRAGTPAPFRGPRDGFGVAILDTAAFKAGPAFKVRFARRESSDGDLRGLGNVDFAFEAGGFVEYWPTQWLRTRAELRQGIGGHQGLVSDITADLVVPVGPQWTLSGGPRVTLATKAATSPYFSVTQTQSVASGLPVYDAGGGLRSYGAGAQARYAWSPQWASHVFVEYERLAGDAADAPLVVQRGSRDQVQVGLGLAYSFDMRPLW
jgi:outer membrane protein